MITDRDILWVRKRKFYGLGDLLSGLVSPAIQAGVDSEALDAGEMLVNAATGAAVGSPEVKLGELSTFGITGLQITETIADKLAFNLDVPFDMDPGYQIGFRIKFSASAAVGTDRAVLFAPKFKIIKPGEDYVTMASVATILDTVIANALIRGANQHQWSDRGVKANFFDLDRNDIENGPSLQCVLDATYANAPGTITIMGILMDYCVRKTVGRERINDQPLSSSSILGGTLSSVFSESPNVYGE